MKFQKYFLFATLLAVAGGTVVTSCKDNDAAVDTESTSYVYDLEVEVGTTPKEMAPAPIMQGTNKAPSMFAAPNRLLEHVSKTELTSTWQAGDQILIYNTANNDNDGQAAQYSLATTQSSGKEVSFKGQVQSKIAINASHTLAFMSPGAASVGAKKTITPVKFVPKNLVTKEAAHYAADPTIRAKVDLSVEEQDGTLEGISARHDFQYKAVKPTSINGTTIKAKVGEMDRQIAIWALRFTDHNNNIMTDIDSIHIAEVKSSDVFDLKTGAFLENNDNDETYSISLKPNAATRKFSSAGGKYVYFAALPGKFYNVTISVFKGTAVYTKTYHNAVTLEKNKFYRTDVLNMEPAGLAPSVNVCGTDWATGNFIYYYDGYKEYWGIAPVQWWISGVDIMENGQRANSQIPYQPVHYANDIDLFRFGSIAEAKQIPNAGDKLAGKVRYSICQKFYADNRLAMIETSNRDDARYGDIAWYWTMNNNNKYRLPTGDELTCLYEKAIHIPGYCYTHKGTKVYGSFFRDPEPGETRKRAFPTGMRITKYSNVTALVRANKGLFLPITGHIIGAAGKKIVYRQMTKGTSAYGQYGSGFTTAAGSTWTLFFGTTEWNNSAITTGSLSAYRPVLVESNGRPDPRYAGFREIDKFNGIIP